jgi:hypothetical protein
MDVPYSKVSTPPGLATSTPMSQKDPTEKPSAETPTNKTQAEKRERILRNGALKIQRDGGDWRVLARKLNVPKPYARRLWRRVLSDASKDSGEGPMT